MSQELSYEAYDGAEEVDWHRMRRRLAFALIGVLVLLLLIVTPPLIKLNRYAKGITLSMSQSLGRPVHLDNVSLGLFPVPHLTLENVVVSEDPAFGNEPTIRANTVEANLRLSALWRRPMEFSRVRFLEPSVNLVRSRDGHWNLEGVLIHAAQVTTAPTVQPHRSSAPRFPYIEATGGRINIKVEDDKKPFSLTDAEFALWLPSPEHWNLRLRGTPARTDTNMTDPGVVRIEGSLERAAHMGQVPVSLQMSWHDAPLGEATRLLSGGDQGWRGTLQVDASVLGSLGAGRLTTDVTVNDLRRTDFVPAQALALHLHCVSLANMPGAELSNLSCELPTAEGSTLRLQAESVDLTRPWAAGATVEAQSAPVEWFASWARLLSHRFPLAPALAGKVDVDVSREAVTGTTSSADTLSTSPLALALAGWQGSVALTLPTPTLAEAAKEKAARSVVPRAGEPVGQERVATQTMKAELLPGANGEVWQISLPPTSLELAPDTTLSLAATATATTYQWRAVGQGDPLTVIAWAKRFPPLADNLAVALGMGALGANTVATPEVAMRGSDAPAKASATPASAPVHVDVTCSRGWSAGTGDQRCTRTPEAPHKPGKSHR